MQYSEIQKDQFTVVGITVRTTNEKHKSIKDIKDLWNRFYMERMMDKIQHKVSDNIICLYTDYEKDFTKPYTVILGYEVIKVGVLPERAIARTIPASKYAVFHIQAENLVREIANTWQKIGDTDLKMRYYGNFEIYIPSNENEVDLYVSIQ